MGLRNSDELRLKVMELRPLPGGRRRSIRDITEELARQGIHVSRNSVHKILVEGESERHEAAIEVVKEQVRKHVTSDLDVLDELQQGNLKAWRDMAPRPGHDGSPTLPEGVTLRDWVALGREAREVTETRFRLCGLDPNKSGDVAAVELLTDEQLEAELAEARAIASAAAG